MDIEYLQKKLDNPTMRSGVLLGGAKFLAGDSRSTPAFGDPRYFPFYYYLGKEIDAATVVQIGSQLGLIGACFAQGNGNVSTWVSYETSPYFPESIIRSNIAPHLSSQHHDSADIHYNHSIKLIDINEVLSIPLYHLSSCAILSQECEPDNYSHYLNLLWDALPSEGILIVDYIFASDALGKAFDVFCETKNRTPVKFKTRYGIGIVER